MRHKKSLFCDTREKHVMQNVKTKVGGFLVEDKLMNTLHNSTISLKEKDVQEKHEEVKLTSAAVKNNDLLVINKLETNFINSSLSDLSNSRRESITFSRREIDFNTGSVENATFNLEGLQPKFQKFHKDSTHSKSPRINDVDPSLMYQLKAALQHIQKMYYLTFENGPSQCYRVNWKSLCGHCGKEVFKCNCTEGFFWTGMHFERKKAAQNIFNVSEGAQSIHKKAMKSHQFITPRNLSIQSVPSTSKRTSVSKLEGNSSIRSNNESINLRIHDSLMDGSTARLSKTLWMQRSMKSIQVFDQVLEFEQNSSCKILEPTWSMIKCMCSHSRLEHEYSNFRHNRLICKKCQCSNFHFNWRCDVCGGEHKSHKLVIESEETRIQKKKAFGRTYLPYYKYPEIQKHIFGIYFDDYSIEDLMKRFYPREPTRLNVYPKASNASISHYRKNHKGAKDTSMQLFHKEILNRNGKYNTYKEMELFKPVKTSNIKRHYIDSLQLTNSSANPQLFEENQIFIPRMIAIRRKSKQLNTGLPKLGSRIAIALNSYNDHSPTLLRMKSDK